MLIQHIRRYIASVACRKALLDVLEDGRDPSKKSMYENLLAVTQVCKSAHIKALNVGGDGMSILVKYRTVAALTTAVYDMPYVAQPKTEAYIDIRKWVEVDNYDNLLDACNASILAIAKIHDLLTADNSPTRQTFIGRRFRSVYLDILSFLEWLEQYAVLEGRI